MLRTVITCILFTGFGSGLAFSQEIKFVQTGGPEGCMVFKILPTEVGVYLATYGAGVYFSEDLSQKWHNISHGLDDYKVIDLYHNQWFVFAVAEDNQIYRLIIGDTLWVKIRSPFVEPICPVLTLHDSVMYVECSYPTHTWPKNEDAYAIFESKDNGQTWTRTDKDTRQKKRRSGLGAGSDSLEKSFARIEGFEDLLFGYSYGEGYHVRQDKDSFWTRVLVDAHSIDVDGMTSINSQLYATDRKDIFTSGDRGRTWKPLNLPTSVRPHEIGAYRGKLIIYSRSSRLYTYDVATGELHDVTHGLINSSVGEAITIDSTIYTLHDHETLSRSSDFGQQWSSAYSTSSQRLFGLKKTGNILYMQANYSVMYSTNKGDDWFTLMLPSRSKVKGFFVRNNWCYVFTDSGCVYASRDNGRSWSLVLSLPPLSRFYETFYHFTGFIDEKVYLVRGNERFCYSFMTDTLLSLEFLSSQDNYSRDYYSGWGDTVFSAEKVARSVDGGETWGSRFREFPEDAFISQIFKIDNLLFCMLSYDDGLWLSLDAGGTWKIVTTNMPKNTIISDMISVNDQVFACTTTRGVFYTSKESLVGLR